MNNDSKNKSQPDSRELPGFLHYLSLKNEQLFNLFNHHISHNNGNLWIELDPKEYSEEQGEALYQMWDDFKGKNK